MQIPFLTSKRIRKCSDCGQGIETNTTRSDFDPHAEHREKRDTISFLGINLLRSHEKRYTCSDCS